MMKRRVPGAWMVIAALLVAASAPAAWAQSPARPSASPPAPPGATRAATPATQPMPSPAAPASVASSPAIAARPGAELRVIEDDQIRIEETRLRGQLQRITVAPKGSTMHPYEINVGAVGRDPSQDRSAAGQRVWSVLRF